MSRDQSEGAPGVAHGAADAAIASLAEASSGVAAATDLRSALDCVADGAARATGAEVAVVRVVDTEDALVVRAVSGTSPAMEAELAGTSFTVAEIEATPRAQRTGKPPAALARIADRVRARAALQVPLEHDGVIRGTLELLRRGAAFTSPERHAAELAAAQAVLAIRAFGAGEEPPLGSAAALALAGEALAVGGDDDQTAAHVTRLAVDGTRAAVGLLWRQDAGPSLVLVAAQGLEVDTPLGEAESATRRALASRTAVAVETDGALPGGATVSVVLPLGQPSFGALQLLFAVDDAPTRDELAALATFGVRAAQALRASSDAHAMAAELERTRALIAVVGQATAQLSLAHTLDTAVERVGDLLGVHRLAVYLREEGRLSAAAGVGLAGPHVVVAERILELALGTHGGRRLVAVEDVAADPRFQTALDAAAEAGIEGAIGVPLVARDETIGLFAVFPDRSRALTGNESLLLTALGAQLAVAVQNAQLHEQTKRLGDERERALDSERESARRLRALYEISRSFAQSLSLDATLDAVARTVTEVLDVDLSLIAMPDGRREWLAPRALHVADARFEDAGRALVWRPLRFGSHPLQRLFRLGEPFELTRAAVEELGEPATALLPFLDRGWSGAVVPVATPAEVLASLTLLSFSPGASLGRAGVEVARTIAGQAALAIDNARLYQQQKEFLDTMQRSLLPRSLPRLPGLELGEAYQSSARVEVGGDVYDFVVLEDGRLAVVLGDVIGHGIEAAADMAMAKFVFRSLAREHPSPGDFLQSANDVVVGEIAPGKFITMVYLLVDSAAGTVSGAGAGHPPPRLVGSDGTVTSLDVRGLVLGIEPRQRYDEVVAPLPPGGMVVLYTDGVLEARWHGELYGLERLDAIVSAGRDLSAQDLAETVLADCRDFAGNELADDCAVVVIKRT